MTKKWQLKGNYFESCNCDIMCPCIFLKPPTKGYCKALVAWQINQGNMEDIDLSGLNVGLYVTANGNMVEGNWKIVLYIDAKANDQQKEALTEIYGGEVGGHPAVLASLVGEIIKVSSAKIDIHYTGAEKHLTIEGIAEVAIKALAGGDGAQITVHNAPLGIVPDHAPIVHETLTFKYNDTEEHSHSGTVGQASAFSYQP